MVVSLSLVSKQPDYQTRLIRLSRTDFAYYLGEADREKNVYKTVYAFKFPDC